ncbi:uncharacterized protein IL334_001116 [Kwoniella shivajii]|uniref:SH3 domain-containing protein n=1 Tax=Kwoniella shivajii TaxID=564305 RepID=A0ABZ1CS49_9TREE|nr:hypothetical protein IL334_001116 [Kwoniella shivajii]
MVFANITYEAFFSLLDEYFASRPYLTASSTSTSSSPSSGLPSMAQLQTITRLLPPSRSSNSNNGNPPTPVSPPTRGSPTSPTGQVQPEQDMTQRFISSTIKLGTAGTKSGVSAISRNKDAMDLLGKAGVAGMMRNADKRMNSPPPNQPGATIEEVTVVEQKTKPPPPGKKSGVAGLVSGRSFGHVDTSSKMSAFTSMWKDPQKVKEPVVEHHVAPALSTKHVSMPPPNRRDNSSSSTRAQSREEPALQQVQALYDYEGADSTDLQVQANQIVNLIEKTSADWWTCEDGNGTRGLVPATYLKEL